MGRIMGVARSGFPGLIAFRKPRDGSGMGLMHMDVRGRTHEGASGTRGWGAPPGKMRRKISPGLVSVETRAPVVVERTESLLLTRGADG